MSLHWRQPAAIGGDWRALGAVRRTRRQTPACDAYTGRVMSTSTTASLSGWALFARVARHSFAMEAHDRGPAWMYWAVNALFSTAVAVVLTGLFIGFNPRIQLWPAFWQTWVISQCIGFSVQLLGDRFGAWAVPRGFAQWRAPTRALSIITVVMVAISIGYIAGFALTGRNFLAMVAANPRFAISQFVVAGLALLTWLLISRAQAAQLRREADLARADAQAQALQRQAADAELRALQAQIEPHFLFNTLANAIALVDYQPQQAKRLLERFNEHLRATLAASRRTHTSLGDELQLLEGYLELMQMRMGRRLSYAIDVPEALRNLPFAPLLLQPLVENALAHGLEPKVEGGHIGVSAQRHGQRVRITVADTGLGMAAPASKGNGLGVTNVRQRLQALRGASASLNVQPHAEGCAATLEFDAP
jgi:signal transduction histidine kinase